MWLTFIGDVWIVVRKNSHIAVEVALRISCRLPSVARVVIALINMIKLLFFALLAYLSVVITDRMQIQPLTVFDLSMSTSSTAASRLDASSCWRARRRISGAMRAWDGAARRRPKP